MSTDIFRRYLDLLNEERGPAPTEFKPTHYHKNFLGGKIPLMQTPDGSFWWETTATSDDGGPVQKGGARKSIQPWIGDTTDLSGLASVDGVIKDGKPVAFPDGTTWKDNADNQNAEVAAGSTASSVVKDEPPAAASAEKEKEANAAAGDGSQVINRADQKVSGGEEGNSELGGDTHCARCGTPKMMHRDLNHDFVPGDDRRPDPVPQTKETGNSERSNRIKKMQEELKKAGADLGTFGPDGNGIDGVIGKFTRAAMAKYPDIAKKYPELGTGGAENKEPKVNLNKLNTALSTIESILKKYKVKINEDKSPLTSADQMKNWRSLMEARPGYDQYGNETGAGYGSARPTGRAPATPPASARSASQRIIPPIPGANLTPAQQAAQRAGLGMPRLATTPAAATGSSAVRNAAGAAAKTLGRVAPGAGLFLGGIDAYNRAKEGDYTGAGISGLAGIAALFPGPGTWISGGLLALGLARDLAKDPTVAISPEDAKTIAENIKIIQDWQKDPANQAALTPELKNRLATVLKGVATLGVPTQSAEPAPAAADPANGSTNGIPAATADINTTLDNLDKYLKKRQFESVHKERLKNQHLLSETERMALHRDLFKEDWTDTATGAAIGAAGAAAAGAARQSGAATTAIPTPPGRLKSLLDKSLSALRFVGRGTVRVGWWGALIGAGVAAKSFWDWIMSDPRAASAAGITPQELQEWKQLDDQLNQLIPDRETFDALPYDVQKKAIEIAARNAEFKKFVIDKAEKKAAQPPK